MAERREAVAPATSAAWETIQRAQNPGADSAHPSGLESGTCRQTERSADPNADNVRKVSEKPEG